MLLVMDKCNGQARKDNSNECQLDRDLKIFFAQIEKKWKSSMKVIMINGIEVIGRQRLMKANFRERKNKMARFILGASLLYPADPATNFIKFFYLSCEIFQNSSRVDSSSGSNTTMASRSVLQMSVNSAYRELYGNCEWLVGGKLMLPL